MPLPISRLLTLLFVPYYLFVLSMVLLQAHAGLDPHWTCTGMMAGATSVCVLLAIWSVQFAEPDTKSNRFSIRSLIIVTSILSIYLAYFRLLIAPYYNSMQWNPGTIFGLTIQFSIFCVFSTIILAMFTETILRCALYCKRFLVGLFSDV